MNNKEFIADLTSRTPYSNREVASLVSAAVSVITGELTEENTVSIQGFGAFEVKKKLERVLFNPITKQRMLVPPKLTLNFRISPTWKDQLKNGGAE